MDEDKDQLAADLAELGAIVSRLKERAGRQLQLKVVVDQQGPSYASYAKAVVEGRLRLQRFVPGNYFSDPAFDMLLDLFVASDTGAKRSFKACALASRVPPATASRYLEMMERDGLVIREPDPEDRRRTLFSLTDSAMTALRGWLASISSIPLRREWRA